MNLKQLTKATHTNNLIITENTILHLVPEFGHSSFEYIYSSGISLNNCFGIVVKTGNFKIGTKTINGRKIFLQAKDALTNDPDKTKNINVFPTIPKKITDKQFLLIDHTITSNIVQYITKMSTVRRGIEVLINELKNEFQYVKSLFPNYNNNVIFFLGPNKPEIGISDLLIKIPTLDKDEFKFNIFDKTAMVNFKLSNNNPVIFSIAGFDKDGKVETYNNNIRSLPDLYTATEKKIIPNETLSLSGPQDKENLAVNNKIQKLAKSAEQTTLKLDNDGKINSLVNHTELNKILKKYKIQDDSIANNIKHSLDNYLNKKENINNNIHEEELEKTVLKAIHQSIFGTSKIHDQYLDNPAQLFSKLQEANTYSKELSYPDPKGHNLIKPKDIIDLKKVSGLVRQEYEFSNNIHEQVKELFNSLEDRKLNPVKIKNIKYHYQDDDLNRIINYEITLQNLTGGEKKPYTVNVKIPALVNDRYFKLNGKSYILSNQQIFTPVTKTSPEEVRLISSFSTSTFSVVNMKFNLSETSKIIEYISSHYPELIIKMVVNNGKVSSAELKGNIFIDLIGSPAYTDVNQSLILDENGTWVVKAKEKSYELTTGKAEYLFDRLIDIISKINPEEKLHKTVKSLPYLQAYIGDTKIPIILYLWQQLGLLNALTKCGIDFEIETVGTGISLPLANRENIFIHPKNKRQELIVNGLFLLDKNLTIKFNKDEINSSTILDDYLEMKYGKGTIYRLNLNAQNMIDPITKKLLEFQDKPTNQINLIIEDIIPKLLNDEADKLTDLKIYRNRQAEIIFNLLYKNLMMAHNRYSNEIKFGNENAKMFIRDNYVIESLLGIDPHSKGNSVVQLSQPYSPIAELKDAAKCIKSGPSGIPSKRSFKASHRNVHPSYISNIGANATSEYAEVGLI